MLFLAHHAVRPSVKPPNQKLLAVLREQRLKEVKMYGVIREVGGNNIVQLLAICLRNC